MQPQAVGYLFLKLLESWTKTPRWPHFYLSPKKGSTFCNRGFGDGTRPDQDATARDCEGKKWKTTWDGSRAVASTFVDWESPHLTHLSRIFSQSIPTAISLDIMKIQGGDKARNFHASSSQNDVCELLFPRVGETLGPWQVTLTR